MNVETVTENENFNFNCILALRLVLYESLDHTPRSHKSRIELSPCVPDKGMCQKKVFSFHKLHITPLSLSGQSEQCERPSQ